MRDADDSDAYRENEAFRERMGRAAETSALLSHGDGAQLIISFRFAACLKPKLRGTSCAPRRGTAVDIACCSQLSRRAPPEPVAQDKSRVLDELWRYVVAAQLCTSSYV